VKKLPLIAITLLILGAAAIGFGVYSFNEASRLQGYAEDYEARADAVAAKEAATLSVEERSDLNSLESTPLYRTSDSYWGDATETENQAWTFVGVGAALAVAGAVVLVAHRRRVANLAPIKKKLVIGITLMVLGLTSGVLAVFPFISASEHERLKDQSLTQADEAMTRATTGQPENHDTEIREAEFRANDAATYNDFAQEATLQAWLLTAGAVVLLGSGVLVLRAQRKSATRTPANADPEATQVIQRI
jgi:hypothetical protein